MSTKVQRLQQQYQAIMHGVQTGIEYRRQYDRKFVEEKHQLVGITSTEVTHGATLELLTRRNITERQIEQGALAQLLIEKGIFTLEEYVAALVEFADRERKFYERELTQHYGSKITLL